MPDGQMYPDRRHRWTAAVTIGVKPGQIRRAVEQQQLVVLADTLVHVVDVYCSRCRRSYTPERDLEPVCKFGAQHVGGPRARTDDSIPAPR